MNSDARLDSPPPPSRFRRPWSPDPLDSFNSSSYNRRREPSDVSVEALDLADYAMSLPRRAIRPYDNHYKFTPNDPSPQSPRGTRPFARSRDSLEPPPLASPGGTLSTTTSSHSPRHRPWSLPPRSNDPHSSSQRSAPRIADHDHYLLSDGPYTYQDHETEIDIGRFPSFARRWYPNHRPNGIPPPSAYHSVPNTDGVSPFDPAFPTHKHNSFDSHKSFQKQPFSDFGYHSVPSSRDSHSRNVLPWVNEAQDLLAEQLDPEIKEERIRMLEREFARKGVGKGFDDDENLIGSADRRGRLITQGPKKRLATRCFQTFLTLGAAISLIYIALAIKPKKSPPPQGTVPFYLLYVLSILTFLFVTYLFLIFPYCCLGRDKDSKLTGLSGPEGLMVLPVQHLPGGGKHKGSKGEKKKNKKGRTGGGDVQVNLIVDPNILGGSRRGRGEDEDEEASSWLGTNSGRSGGSNGRGPATPKRRSVFVGLALEAKWKSARKRLKWAMVADIVCLILWGAEFVMILAGQRCPPGGFGGWCDGYNLATSFACLSCLLFGLSVFFDIKDLHGSRISPRTRT